MKTYYRLTKPGIVYGNALTAFAAFLFASGGNINFLHLAAMLIGLMSIIAASCVVNNVMDRDIDTRMERTKERAIATGKVSLRSALLFAGVLFAVGITVLLFTNLLTLLVTLFGVFVYVLLYTPLKRVTRHSTIVGALAGAVPPVVGYVAVTNTLDNVALALFIILVCWQMVHFLAIAIFRREDYRGAGLPVMPVRFSIFRTKVLMVIYAIAFAYALFALSVISHLGFLFTIPMGVLAFGWIAFSIIGFRSLDDVRWGRMMFFYSLVILLVFCLALSLSMFQVH
jgi:protoheme IX farnesyltransferase